MCARRHPQLDPDDEAASYTDSFNYDPDYLISLDRLDSFCQWEFDLRAPWGDGFAEEMVTDCLNAFTARFSEVRRNRIVCR